MLNKNEQALNDPDFLKALDVSNVKKTYVRIFALDSNEDIIQKIDVRATSGSITIDGSATVRRAGNITFIVDNKDTEINVRTYLSINKKIKLLIGIENTIDDRYDKIIWFNQGIYVINSINFSHNTNSLTASIQIKDKMCLLNGDCGGRLPAVVEFGSYEQEVGIVTLEKIPDDAYDETKYFPYICYNIGDKHYKWSKEKGFEEDNDIYNKAIAENEIDRTITIDNSIFDIIRTLVCNYGGEDLGKIIISDIPNPKMLNHAMITSTIPSGKYIYYNIKENKIEYTETKHENDDNYVQYNQYDVCGFTVVDYIYGTKLTTGYSDTICTVLDKIKAKGNYEYFYDIDGNFIFREIQNYLNTQYDPVETCYKDEEEKSVYMNKLFKTLGGVGSLLDNKTYNMDISSNSSSIYTFGDSDTFCGSPLITSYTNTPNYNNIKNDFHIWGFSSSNKASGIHYHIAIKDKPYPEYYAFENVTNKKYISNNPFPQYSLRKVKFVKNSSDEYDIKIAEENESGVDYIPLDWRAELYMQGLVTKERGLRPDMHQQELLDFFREIYDFSLKNYYNSKTKEKIILGYDNKDIPNGYKFVGYGAFKQNLNTEAIKYWIDYLDSSELSDISIDKIGYKIYTHKQDNVERMCNKDVLDIVFIDKTYTKETKQEYIDLAIDNWKDNIQEMSSEFMNLITGTTYGYSMQDVAREVLYKYTDYISGISLTSIPIYYLEPNRRITVYDKDSEIYGDYIIKSISIPLDTKGTMSISASRTATRV